MKAIWTLTIAAALGLALPALAPSAHAHDGAQSAAKALVTTFGETDPEPITRVAPEYPQAALDEGLEGMVVVELTIAKDGSVKDVKVVKSSDPVFEETTLQAVRQWKYAPQMEDGKAVERSGVRVSIEYRLDLDDEE